MIIKVSNPFQSKNHMLLSGVTNNIAKLIKEAESKNGDRVSKKIFESLD